MPRSAEGSAPESLSSDAISEIASGLADAHARFAATYPGEGGGRQPAHTVYGGAHLFRADAAAKLGRVALRYLEEYAPDPETLAAAVGLSATHELAAKVYDRVRAKLEREPVEDFRIDFEDGFGHRSDDEEDAVARAAAGEVARGMSEGTLPPFIGIRIKPFSVELTRRGLRTLDLFLTALAGHTGGRLLPGFVVTLPKVVASEQVGALVAAFERLETELPIERGSLRLEIMVETPQSIIGADGRTPLRGLVAAGRGRCIAAHFGVYDYTASTSITAEYQRMRHPACDAARQTMLVSLAGTGVWLSDGATNLLPVPRHRATSGGPPLDAEQLRENRESVHSAWRLHYDDIRHSLVNGFYQGWDLHPAQLVTRYAALYAFFLESLDAAAERLANFVEKAAQATLTGDVFDDAATGQGLLNFFLRGLNCGAITEAEATGTGLTLEELRTRSFVKILEGRAG